MLKYKSDSMAVFQSELYQTNAAVIETKDLILITDPNYLPSEVEAIREYVDQVKGDHPVYLFFTHSDFDHIVGYGSFTDCHIIAGQFFHEQTDRQKAVDVVINLDDEFYIDRPYEIVYPRVDHVIYNEGEKLIVGDTVLTFYSAYGHNPDGMMCLVQTGNILITGDYLSDIEFPFVFGTYAAYRNTLSTLSRLLEQNPGLFLLPSHGLVTDNPEEIRKRIAVSEAYLQLTEELLDHPEDTKFQSFMADNNYRYKRGFVRRHEANINVLAQGRLGFPTL